MALPGVLAGLLPEKPRAETPTTSLYFSVPLAEALEAGRLQRVEPNVFLARDTLVVMRHWSATTRRLLKERPEVQVIYFIDDDLWGLQDDESLGAAYLGRLRRLAKAFDEELRPRTAAVVSPSPRILAHFADVETHLLAPALIHPLAGLDHHDEADGPVSMVFCGTASHLADLSALSGALAEIMRGGGLHLTTFLGTWVPEALRLETCTHLAPQSWADYRRTITTMRFHIGLAPLEPTAFNMARSGSRLLDHAVLGAAGLYSATGPFSELVDDGINGRLVDGGPEVWGEAISALAADRSLCRRLAEGGQATAVKVGDPGRVRRFWSSLLSL